MNEHMTGLLLRQTEDIRGNLWWWYYESPATVQCLNMVYAVIHEIVRCSNSSWQYKLSLIKRLRNRSCWNSFF